MQTSNRLGSIFALLALFIVCMLFYAHLRGFFDHPFVRASGRIVLRASPDGHYRTRGKINGYPVVFMVDTGASNIALSSALANKIGLKKGREGRAETANGTTTMWFTTLESVEIKGLTAHHVTATINPRMGQEVLLGINYLRHFQWQQKDRELILTPNPSRH